MTTTIEMQEFALELLRAANAQDNGDDVRLWALQKLNAMSNPSQVQSSVSWQESLVMYRDILAKRAAYWDLPDDERHELTWPWSSWNKLLGPMQPGMLAVLAGGDGQGKTVYAECIAEHWAKHKAQVVFVHYELSHPIMWDRRMARHARIPVRALSDRIAPDEREHVERTLCYLETWRGNVQYQHAPGWTMERTIAALAAMHEQRQCDVVVVDYLEKVAVSTRQSRLFGSQNQREADNVEMLKVFAEAYAVPVVVLSQFNKQGKGETFSAMDRGSIRGAGEKSEKANIVVLLRRDKNDGPEGGYATEVKVKVDKNTLGPMGNFVQHMDAEHFSVLDTVATPLEDAGMDSDE